MARCDAASCLKMGCMHHTLVRNKKLDKQLLKIWIHMKAWSGAILHCTHVYVWCARGPNGARTGGSMPATSAIWRELVFQTLNESMIPSGLLSGNRSPPGLGVPTEQRLYYGGNETLFIFWVTAFLVVHIFHIYYLLYARAWKALKAVCPW